MDLPSEPRLKIYEHALVRTGGIEFCPEPYYMHRMGDHHVRNIVAADHEKSCSFHEDCSREELKPFTKLLRASKTVHAEATAVFLGSNEFRFTNSSGWFALDRFLYILGVDKTRMLRKITIMHPDFTVLPTSLSLENRFWDGMSRSLAARPGSPETLGSVCQRTRWFDAQKITPDPALVLEKTKTLLQLRLLLPPTCEGVVDCPVDQEKFENLTVTFAATEIPKLLPNAFGVANGSVPPPARPEDGKTWAQVTVDGAGHRGWRAETLRMDELGCYGGIGAEVPVSAEDDTEV